MNNQELVAKIDEVIEALLAIERHLGDIVNQARVRETLQAAQGPVPTPGAEAGWPWTPATATQGFLAARWLRRDGAIYGGAVARGAPGPNSPVRGGDDANAKVDVPSGAPRVAPFGPT